MRRILLSLLAIVVVFSYLNPDYVSGQDASEKIKLRLATAYENSSYYDIGKYTELLGCELDLNLKAIPSQGSWENLNFIRNHEAEFALTQLDSYIEYRNTYLDSSIVVIQPLYTEYLHIIVRNPLRLTDFDQFVGKRIFVGRPRSGTAITAENLLSLMGVSPNEYTLVDAESPIVVGRMFLSDSLDIAMYVDALDNRYLRDLMNTANCRLFSLYAGAIKYITRDVPREKLGLVHISAIPARTYMGQESAVVTVAVPVLLVAKKDIQPAIIKAVNQLVQAAIDSVRSQGEQGKLEEIGDHLRRPPGIILDPAGNWPSASNSALFFINIGVLLVVIFLLAMIMRKYSCKIVRFCRSRWISIVLFSAAGICLACAIGIYSLEHSINEYFGTLYETLWSILIYITSGLENRIPITTAGRIMASLLLIAGPVFLALLIGFFASSIILNALESKMAKNQKDHYVILNWSNRTMEVIKQLHSVMLGEEGRSVIVVVSDDPNLNFKELQQRFNRKSSHSIFEDVYFCPGDPCEEDSLLNANVQDSKAVIIMADEGREGSADEKTFRSLMAVRKVVESENAKKPDKQNKVHVVVELINTENSYVVENIATRFPGTVDLVAGGRVRTLLLAQATLIPGLTQFYRDLLAFGEETNEVYLIPLPKSAVDLTFSEFVAKIVSRNDSNRQPMIPLGIFRNVNGKPEIATNPKPKIKNGEDNPLYKLRENDQLLVLTYGEPKESDLILP
jgi:TRAP transporter TAXI family solute receptor